MSLRTYFKTPKKIFVDYRYFQLFGSGITVSVIRICAAIFANGSGSRWVMWVWVLEFGAFAVIAV